MCIENGIFKFKIHLLAGAAIAVAATAIIVHKAALAQPTHTHTAQNWYDGTTCQTGETRNWQKTKK